jgi:hypothetical protein
MGMSAPPPGPLSLLGITIRRSIVMGRTYLIIGTGLAVLVGSTLSVAGGGSGAVALPLFLPVFTVQGAMGGLMVFTNDRTKGVLEYLLAYGVSERQIFVNSLLIGLALDAMVVGTATVVGLGASLATGHALTLASAEYLGLYGIPMSLAAVAFACTVGMYWTALSPPRAGMNSPIGLVPFVGILPALATLFAVEALAGTGNGADAFRVGAFAVLLVAVVVVVLISRIGRLLRRERMLSPM